MLHIISQIHELEDVPLQLIWGLEMIALKSYILLKSSPRISSSVSTRKLPLASVNTIGGLIFSTLWNGPLVLSRMALSLMRLAIYDAWAGASSAVSRSRISATLHKKLMPLT